MIGDPPQGLEVVMRPSGRSGSGQETLREVRKCRETLPEVSKWSGGSPGGSKVVGRPSGRSESGREIVPEVRKW